MIYYSTSKAKFLQLIRERLTYASREDDGCLISLQKFENYEIFSKVLRGSESKVGWIQKYNLECSPSTRNRHKKKQPVFDLVLHGAVKIKLDGQKITKDMIEMPSFDDLMDNDFRFYDITACLVVTFPKEFQKISEDKTALFDLSNLNHIQALNRKIKNLIVGAEKFEAPQSVNIFKNYQIEKRKPKISPEQAERQYQKKLKLWEKEFKKDPTTPLEKPKRSIPSKHEWTVCLSMEAKETIAKALKGLMIAYDRRHTYPNGEAGFLAEVDRVHNFISKYSGHRGVRSDIGNVYSDFKKHFSRHTKGLSVDSAFKGHVLTLKYVGQMGDEYKKWEFGNTFHKTDCLELMLLRAGDYFQSDFYIG